MLSHTRRAVVGVVFLTAAVSATACGPNARQTALKTSLTALNAARDGFVQWDKQKQTKIVADAKTLEDGKKALADYRSKRAPVIEGFTVAYSALALAALDDNMARLTEAINTAAALYKLIKSLTGGAVEIPKPGGP